MKSLRNFTVIYNKLSFENLFKRLFRTGFLIVLFNIVWTSQVNAAGIQLNQEGFYANGYKTAYLFLANDIAQVLEPNVLYQMALIQVNGEGPVTAVYQSPWVNRENLKSYLGEATNSLINTHPEYPNKANIGNPTGAWMYEWNFTQFNINNSSLNYQVVLQRQVNGGADSPVAVYSSQPFKIGKDAMKGKYNELANAAFKYFYIHRLGQPTDPAIVSAEGFAPEEIAHSQAFHSEPVPCFMDWCGDGNPENGGPRVGGGTAWADAADFGLYPVNHAMAAWTLLNLIEFDPSSYQIDAAIEAGDTGWYDRTENGVTRRYHLASEVEVGSRWMWNLINSLPNHLMPHKIHNQGWDTASAWDFDAEAKVMPAFGPGGEILNSNLYDYRSAARPSTAATYAVCRTAAHLSRVMAKFGKSVYADNWLAVAWSASVRADNLPTVLYPQDYARLPQTDSDGDGQPDADGLSSVFQQGGGPYGDTNISDDQFACYVELYLARYARDPLNPQTDLARNLVMGHSEYNPGVGLNKDFGYDNVRTPAILSLLVADNNLPEEDIADFRNLLYWAGFALNSHLGTETEAVGDLRVSQVPRFPHYWSSHPNNWWWASNSAALAHGILLSHAAVFAEPKANLQYRLSPLDFARASLRTLDYVLGSNVKGMSFITGFGDVFEQDTHDRMAWAVKRDSEGAIPFPRGWLSGGPQNDWASCYGGAELNWNGGNSYEYYSTFWGTAEGTTLSTDDAYTKGFVGPEIVDVAEHPEYADGIHRYVVVPGSDSRSISSGQIVAQYLSERTRLGESAKLPSHRPIDSAGPYAAASIYPGLETGPNAWCTKENAINYNANLTWMAFAGSSVLQAVLEGGQGGVGSFSVGVEVERTDTWEGGYCNKLVVSNTGNEPAKWSNVIMEENTIYDSWNLNFTQVSEGAFLIDGGPAQLPWCEPNDPDCAGNFEIIYPGQVIQDIGYCVNTNEQDDDDETSPGDDGLTVSYEINNQSQGVYCATVTVTNNSLNVIDPWSADFVLQEGGNIYDFWNVNYTQSGNKINISPVGWNNALNPGESTHSIGFCANN